MGLSGLIEQGNFEEMAPYAKKEVVFCHQRECYGNSFIVNRI